MQSQRKVKGGDFLIAEVVLLLVFCGTVWGQCSAGAMNPPPEQAQIQQAIEQHNWTEVVRLAAPLPGRSSDVNFEYGLALAHLERWIEARATLKAGERACPAQKRFAVELAGIAFELKRYPEAAAWLRKALRLDPKDEYANNFAGTVYLLMGNTNAALEYWNRLEKPNIAAINFDSQLRLQKLILDRAFAFSPAAVLNERDFETTQSRLDELGVFPRYNIVLNARSDGKFDAEFHAAERDGFGSSRLQALISTFGGAAYETVYPSYFNIGRAAMNFESLLRWDGQKRRVWLSMSAPLNDRPGWRWALKIDARDENWAIRHSFTGNAPVLGSLDLERQSVTGTVTGIPNGRLRWSTGAEFSHRNYHSVVEGTALTPALVVPGYELKALASIEGKVLQIPERRFTLTATANAELARLWAPEPQVTDAPGVFGRLQGSAMTHWFPRAQDDKYEVEQRVRLGRTLGSAPLDELFLLGMERDTDLWLRGQIGTRDRKKGSSPLADSYFLSNSDFYRRVYGNGLFSIKAGPLLDVARAGAPTGGLSTRQWLFDVGVDTKITVLGTSVVLTYGRDLRSGSNAFYATVIQR
ncbi:MAG TPA: tetratricopeptide repeat protein [Terracidiphilus sp.]|nr:tetratricopeptide repeat protein [Terracidiphilus sp.]